MLGVICAHCKSNHTQPAADAIQCLSCGHRTGADGEKLPIEPRFFQPDNAYERRPK